ncbi:MAG: dynamin family protein, partial [Methylocystis sp.]
MIDQTELARSANEAVRLLSPAAELLRQARAILGDPDESELEREYANIVRSDEPTMRIAVLGPFSAGKSTFLNALVSRFTRQQTSLGSWVYSGLLPSDRQIKTAICTTVCDLPEDKAEYVEIVYANGDARRLKPEEGGRYISLEPTRSSIAETVLRFISKPDRAVRAAFFLHLAPWLRGVVLVDTPGLDSRAEGHSEMALRSVQTADAVLYLVDDTINDADRRALIDIKDYVSTIIFVQTKADLPEDGLESRMASNGRAVGEWLEVTNPTFLPVSATFEMAAVAGDDVPDSGFAALRRQIEVVCGASVDARIIALRRRIAGHLAALGRLLDEKIAAMDATSEDNSKRIVDLRSRIAGAEPLGRSLDMRYASVKEEISQRIEAQRRASIAMMTGRTASERRGNGSSERCATAIQREARKIFERDIRPYVKAKLADVQTMTVNDLREKLHATLRPVDLEPGEIILTKPIIASNILGRFWRWLTASEIPESEIRDGASTAYRSIREQVLDKVDELIGRLQEARKVCQTEHIKYLKVRVEKETQEISISTDIAKRSLMDLRNRANEYA